VATTSARSPGAERPRALWPPARPPRRLDPPMATTSASPTGYSHCR